MECHALQKLGEGSPVPVLVGKNQQGVEQGEGIHIPHNCQHSFHIGTLR